VKLQKGIGHSGGSRRTDVRWLQWPLVHRFTDVTHRFSASGSKSFDLRSTCGESGWVDRSECDHPRTVSRGMGDQSANPSRSPAIGFSVPDASILLRNARESKAGVKSGRKCSAVFGVGSRLATEKSSNSGWGFDFRKPPEGRTTNGCRR